MTYLNREPGRLCATREEALAQPGLIYIHLKKGGIYRRVCDPKWAGEAVVPGSLDEGDRCAVYEHLWPHEHDFYVRPVREFSQVVHTQHGKHHRFEFHINTEVIVLP